jgi:hypothetical protein
MPAHSAAVISMVSAAAVATNPATARNAKHALLMERLNGKNVMALMLLWKKCPEVIPECV